MTAENVDNRERGLNLNTRGRGRRTDIPDADAGTELEAMRGRIEAARGMIAPLEDRHCSECAQRWTNGRDAAIKAIEG